MTIEKGMICLKHRFLSVLLAVCVLLGVLPLTAAAEDADYTAPALVIRYKMQDENGQEVPYSADSGCYVRKYGGAATDAIADGAVFESFSDSRLTRNGRMRLVAYTPDTYCFVGWEDYDTTRLSVGSPSTPAEPSSVARSGRMISSSKASTTIDPDNVMYITAVFKKLPQVHITFDYDAEALSGLSYQITARNSNSTDSYSTTGPVTPIAPGETVTFIYGDKMTLKTTYTERDDFTFSGYYLGDAQLYASADYSGFVAGVKAVDGDTVQLRYIDRSFREVSDYTPYEGLTVETRGIYPWTVQADGSLASSNQGVSDTVSILKITPSTDGKLAFEYKTSTNLNNGFLLYNNGTEITVGNGTDAQNWGKRADYAGDKNWTTEVISVTAGTPLYLGYYKSSSSGNSGEDTIWIRNLKMADGTYNINVSSSNATYGTAVASATSGTAGDKITLTATENAGGHFYGWFRVDGNSRTLLSQKAEYELTVFDNETIEALFDANNTYVARIGNTFYHSLGEAVTAAGSNGKVVIVDDFTLEEDVTIPSGVTVVIPYDSDDDTVKAADDERPYANTRANGATYSITQANDQNHRSYTVTVASGYSLNVADGGKLIVGGEYSGNHPVGGQVYGKHANIELSENSELNVSGILSCSGYITGSGKVHVTDGEVYENFIVTDFHGGSYTMNCFMANLSPFNAYTIMGIQSDMTFEAGASLYGYCCLYANETQNSVPAEILGGSNALIILESGTATLKYDTERSITYTLNDGKKIGPIGTVRIISEGDVTIGSLKMNLAGVMTADTATFECPLSYNFVLEQKSGELTIDAMIKLMPGAEITVDEGATLTLAKDAKLIVYEDYDMAYGTFNSYPRTADLNNAHMTAGGTVTVAGTLNVGEEATLAGTVNSVDGAVFNLSESAVITAEVIKYTYDYETGQFTQHSSTNLPATLTDPQGQSISSSDGSLMPNTTYADVNGTLIPATVITYNKNDGSEAPEEETQVIEYNQTGAVLASPFTRDYYNFTGWNDQPDGSGTPYQPGDPLTPEGAMTLYAQWAEKTYTVEFRMGSDTYTQTGIRFGETVAMPETLVSKLDTAAYTYTWSAGTAAGFELPEFAADATFSMPDAADDKLIITITSAARTFTISFAEDAVTGQTYDPVTVTYGEEFTLPSPAAPAGYKSLKWQLEGQDFNTQDPYLLTKDITLTPVWSTVAYTDNWSWSGSGSEPAVTLILTGDDNSVLEVDSQAVTLTETARTAPTCQTAGSVTFRADYSLAGTDYSNTHTYDLPKAAHTLTKFDKVEATCETDGTIEYWTCEVCGQFFSDAAGTTAITEADLVIPAKGHDWNEGAITAEATCVTPGVRTYTCKNDPSHTRTEEIPALGHTYGEPTWTWSADYSSATATFVCSRPGCVEAYEGHAVAVETTDISAKTLEPTHTAGGYTTYTATVEWNGQTYTGGTVVVLSATGHTYGDPNWTWSADYSSATATFTCVDGDATQTVTAQGSDITRTETPATCTAEGKAVYTATVTFEEQTYTGSAEETLPLAAHTLEHHDRQAPSCAATGTEEYWYCTVCEKYFADEAATQTVEFADLVLEMVPHTYGQPAWTWTGYESATATFTCGVCGDTETVTAQIESEVTTPPTETTEGVKTYTATVTFEGQTYTDTAEETLPVVPAGFQVTFTNKVGNLTPATVDHSSGLYSGALTFQVTCTNACTVGYTTDGGKSYKTLKAAAVAGVTNTYAFTVDVQSEMEIVVVLKGDVDGNGKLTSNDSSLINRHIVKTAAHKALTTYQILIADVDGNGKITSNDSSLINRAIVKTAAHKALIW